MAGEIVITLAGDADSLRRTLRGAEKDVGGLAGAAQTLQKNWLAVGSAIAATEGARRIISGMVSAASDQVEAQNKVNVVFGDSAAIINRFAESSSRDFGISKTAALDAAGAYGNMFTTIGLGGPEMAEMSARLVELAADMSSFNNADPSEMLAKLQSGLAGEAEPLRQVGVLLSAARVEEEAYASGIAKRGEALTEAQKVQARYNLILQDTSVQQGDVERSSGTLATEQRKLAAQWDDLTAKLGQGLIPVALEATLALTGMVNVIDAIIEKTQASIDWALNIKITAQDEQGNDVAVSTALKAIGLGAGQIVDTVSAGASAAATGIRAVGSLIPQHDPAPILMPVDLRDLMGEGPAVTAPRPSSPGALLEWVNQVVAAGPDIEQQAAAMKLVFDYREMETRAMGAQSSALSELARIQEQIVAENTAELVQAYYEGGAKQVEIVRASQLEQEAEWAKVAEGMHDVLGVELPEEFRGMWERYLEVQQEGIDAAIEEEQRLRNERAQNAARGYIAILEAHARAGLPFTGSIEDFDFDLGRTNLTPDEQFLSGQTPIVLNATLQLSNGQETDIYVLGQEGARSVGLEPYVGPRA